MLCVLASRSKRVSAWLLIHIHLTLVPKQSGFAFDLVRVGVVGVIVVHDVVVSVTTHHILDLSQSGLLGLLD